MQSYQAILESANGSNDSRGRPNSASSQSTNDSTAVTPEAMERMHQSATYGMQMLDAALKYVQGGSPPAYGTTNASTNGAHTTTTSSSASSLAGAISSQQQQPPPPPPPSSITAGPGSTSSSTAHSHYPPHVHAMASQPTSTSSAPSPKIIKTEGTLRIVEDGPLKKGDGGKEGVNGVKASGSVGAGGDRKRQVGLETFRRPPIFMIIMTYSIL